MRPCDVHSWLKCPINILAVIGLTFGGVFGNAGTFTANPNLRASLWAIDSAGLMMATALLALKYFRTEHDLVAGDHAPWVSACGCSGGAAAVDALERRVRVFFLFTFNLI